MSKIDLSLESNIKLIDARGISGYKIPVDEVQPLLTRIRYNFFYHLAESIALECLLLWEKTHRRDSITSLLLIALEMENQWRYKHKYRYIIKLLTSTQSFERVTLQTLLNLKEPAEDEIHKIFQNMPYSEFLKSAYWQTVRLATLVHNGFECQADVNGAQCGAKEHLDCHHISYENARGYEHRHYKTDLTILCRKHHTKHHQQERLLETERIPVGKSGATWGNLWGILN